MNAIRYIKFLEHDVEIRTPGTVMTVQNDSDIKLIKELYKDGKRAGLPKDKIYNLIEWTLENECGW